jgi:hypothetical protein
MFAWMQADQSSQSEDMWEQIENGRTEGAMIGRSESRLFRSILMVVARQRVRFAVRIRGLLNTISESPIRNNFDRQTLRARTRKSRWSGCVNGGRVILVDKSTETAERG